MRALITKGGAAQPSNAADDLAEEEKVAVATSSSMVDKGMLKHVNGKPQNVKNVTWTAKMVQEFHTGCSHTHRQDEVDISAEDAGEAKDCLLNTPDSADEP